MSDYLISPISQFQKQPKFSRSFDFSAMERLDLEEQQQQGLILVDFTLKKTKDGLMIVLVSETTLPLLCQRCLTTVLHSITINNELLIVDADFNEADFEGDFVLSDNNKLSLLTLVEDEILLNLPLLAKHNPNDCPIKLPSKKENIKTYKPFANLDKLR